jgi:zinc transporter
MAHKNGILHACTIDGNGGGKTLSGNDISDEIKNDGLAWVHLNLNEKGSRRWIKKEISYLDDIIINALLADETRPRMFEFGNGVLMILRGMNLNENAEPEDMVSIRLWIDPCRIISVQRRNAKAINDILESLMAGQGPKNCGNFIAMLTARLFERMEPVLADLDEQTDNVEEKVMESPDPAERQQIIDIRKQAIIFRRYITPQRDVLAHLRVSNLEWLDQTDRRHLQESLDRLIRYVEDLDMVRERAQIVKDELTNALADKMNKNLYMLSIVAAIFLPLSFLTGLLGINVAGIPGADDPQAFMVFIGILVVVIALQMLLFKKLKWL